MLAQIKLTDFKAFQTASLNLRPITVLIGPNNSGKSSLLAGVRLLAQTIQSRDPGLPLLLDGPLGDFGTYRDLVYGNHRGRPFGLEFATIQESADGPSRSRLELEFKYRTVRRELVLRQSALYRDNQHLITATLSKDFERHLITRLDRHNVPPAQRSALADSLHLYNFLPRLFLWRRAGRKVSISRVVAEERLPILANEIEESVFGMIEALEEVDYLGAMRRAPERTYHQTGAASRRIGAYGENWAGLLVLDAARPARSRRIVPRLIQWLKKAGLASDVRLNWLSDRHYEVQVQHSTTGEYQNLADVGQANSQVLPVLIGGFRLPAGATYLVEEPEIHLHPRAQAHLGDFLSDLHEAGVQTLVETHSEYLILRLQQHIAAGVIKPRDIAFYYVHAAGSSKRIRELRVDGLGLFDTPLDQGFFPQRLEEARNLALIRSARRGGDGSPSGD